tara:strand:- start:197 stop:1540 length:1344 start_codon:yes stop_codon:yes gene_type:complete
MLVAVATSAVTSSTFISNISPLRTTTGELFDAHDGNTMQLANGSFVRFAMGYLHCNENPGEHAMGCGQFRNNTVGVWSSPTLASGTWSLVQSFTPSDAGWPNCTYYRVHVAQESGGAYVMWLNGQEGKDNTCDACSPYMKKCFLAGVAQTLDAPFKYKNVVEDLRYHPYGVGDFSLFSDGGVAYVIHKLAGSAPGVLAHRMTVQRLRGDLLGGVTPNASKVRPVPWNSTAPQPGCSAGIFGAPFVEAPELFKRKGIFYGLFGQCCAFCEQGSGIGVYTSTASPLGPWSEQTRNIGCMAGTGTTGTAVSIGSQCGCAMAEPSVYDGAKECNAARAKSNINAVTYAQQNSVITVKKNPSQRALLNSNRGGGLGGHGDAPWDGFTFIWTGDRWNSACTARVKAQGLPATDVELHCDKAYDLQYWAPLEWDETTTPHPLPKQLVWRNNFTF